MKKKGNCIRNLGLIMLAIIIYLHFPSINASADDNSITTKDITTHDIAIVFDNSASMYENESWSQALYAVEVFASMIDYDHDHLAIYPMGPISVGKGGTQIKERLDIASKDAVKDIERIYCEKTSATILKPAYTAYEDLIHSSADEVWMIVLTDGAFFYDKSTSETSEEKSPEWLSKRLNDFASQSGGKIKVQYLGFAEANQLSSNPSNNFFADRAGSSTDLTDKLVNICNKIFQRDIIPGVSSDGRFAIDVSMKNLFAFVQGKGAKIKTLSMNDGTVIPEVKSTLLEASKEGGTGNPKVPAPVANVSGCMVEYGTCEAGSYQLEYSGSNLQIFYEPDVTIRAVLTDKDGVEITDASTEIVPGEYTLTYDIVDRSGESASGSKLLGNVVFDDAIVTNNGQSSKVPSGGTIKLESDSETTIHIEATYLTNYHIQNNDSEGLRNLVVAPPAMENLKVYSTVNQSENWFVTGDHDDWKPITVKVEYDGAPLSDEDMQNLQMLFSFDPKLDYQAEIIPGESSYNVYIGKDASGKYTDPSCGKYHFTAKAVMTDEFGQEASSNTAENSFEIQNYAKFWKWLIRLIIFAAIVLLLWFILTRKAWPHKMTFVIKKENGTPSKKPMDPSGSMILVPVFSALKANAKKNTILLKKFSKKANIYVDSISARPNVDVFYINFIPYERGAGFKDSMGNPFSGVVGNNTQIKIVYNDGKEDLDGEIKIN